MANLTEALLRLGNPLGDFMSSNMKAAQLAKEDEARKQHLAMAQLEMTLRQKQEERYALEQQAKEEARKMAEAAKLQDQVAQARKEFADTFVPRAAESILTQSPMPEPDELKSMWEEISKRNQLPTDTQLPFTPDELTNLGTMAQKKALADKAALAEKARIEAEKEEIAEARAKRQDQATSASIANTYDEMRHRKVMEGLSAEKTGAGKSPVDAIYDKIGKMGAQIRKLPAYKQDKEGNTTWKNPDSWAFNEQGEFDPNLFMAEVMKYHPEAFTPTEKAQWYDFFLKNKPKEQPMQIINRPEVDLTQPTTRKWKVVD